MQLITFNIFKVLLVVLVMVWFPAVVEIPIKFNLIVYADNIIANESSWPGSL